MSTLPPPPGGVVSKKMFLLGIILAIVISIVIATLISSVIAVTTTRLGKPNYDSGWVDISPGQNLVLYPNLGTTNAYVYVVGRESSGLLNQDDYGWSIGQWTANGYIRYGVAWNHFDGNTISISRGAQDTDWNQVRVMIWVIS